MNRILGILLALALVLVLSLSAAIVPAGMVGADGGGLPDGVVVHEPAGAKAATQSAVTMNAAPDHYLVVFEDWSIPPGAVEAINTLTGGVVVNEISQIGVLVAEAGADFPEKVRQEVAGIHAGIHKVGPDIMLGVQAQDIADNDLYSTFQWDIKRVGGDATTWAIQKGAGAVVAVLDTGVYWDHPDIAPNYLYGKSYVPYQDENDYHGHGTHVAGAIAAPITQGRVIGIAPEAGIANYKVFNTQGLSMVSWIMAALVDAADDGCHVIYLGCSAHTLMKEPNDENDEDDEDAKYVAFVRATQYAWNEGSLVVVGAGNQDEDSATARDDFGTLDGMPRAITVVSTGDQDERASYSNTGGYGCHISAPGGGILNMPFSYCTSAYSPLSGAVTPGAQYVLMAGTSMAAAKVSGIAALIYAQYPGVSPAMVQAQLFRTAEDIGDFAVFGHGLAHAYHALTTPMPEPEASTPSATGTGDVTFATGEGGIDHLTAVDEDDLPAPPAGLSFPHGFFSFEINGIRGGSTVAVTITFPSALPAGSQYWKYQEDKGWHRIPIVSRTTRSITIELTDGGLGDADGMINGTIVDPGGVGVPPVPVGGTGHLVNRLVLLAPWLALAAVIAGAAVFARRRLTQS